MRSRAPSTARVARVSGPPCSPGRRSWRVSRWAKASMRRRSSRPSRVQAGKPKAFSRRRGGGAPSLASLRSSARPAGSARSIGRSFLSGRPGSPRVQAVAAGTSVPVRKKGLRRNVQGPRMGLSRVHPSASCRAQVRPLSGGGPSCFRATCCGCVPFAVGAETCRRRARPQPATVAGPRRAESRGGGLSSRDKLLKKPGSWRSVVARSVDREAWWAAFSDRPGHPVPHGAARGRLRARPGEALRPEGGVGGRSPAGDRRPPGRPGTQGTPRPYRAGRALRPRRAAASAPAAETSSSASKDPSTSPARP